MQSPSIRLSADKSFPHKEYSFTCTIGNLVTPCNSRLTSGYYWGGKDPVDMYPHRWLILATEFSDSAIFTPETEIQLVYSARDNSSEEGDILLRTEIFKLPLLKQIKDREEYSFINHPNSFLRDSHGEIMRDAASRGLYFLRDAGQDGFRLKRAECRIEMNLPPINAKTFSNMTFASDACVVCLVNRPIFIFSPCRHAVCCRACGLKLETCPYCMSPISCRGFYEGGICREI